MSKNLGYIKLNAKDEDYIELLNSNGLDGEYFNIDAIKSEAEDYIESTGNSSAEVRVDGDNFIEVEA